ncbi:MAG: hypothetical protein R3D58_02035 [Saprospiraceae bacterium]|nr:hypothetical protein [Lewinellaceae bacterium]
MRRFLFLILSVQLLSGNMLAGELWKLPYLVRHFQVHQRQNVGNTLLDFLNLHYANTKHRRSDPAHRQLPLQQIGFHTMSSTLLPEDGQLCMQASDTAPNNALRPTEKNLFPSDYRTRLLRPPQRFFNFSV